MELGYYGGDRNERILRQRIQERWMDAYAPTRHLDPVLIGAALLLTAVGLVAIYSAKYRALQIQDLPTTYYVSKQLLSWGVAIVGLVAAAVIDYRHVRAYAALIYLGAVGLLVLVLTPLGTFVSGCQCWLSFGGFQLQPSELAKVALVIALAALLHERKGEPNLRTLLAAIGIVGVPVALIVLQPDFGTFIVFPWVAFVLIVVGGAKARWLVALGVLAVVAVVAVLRLGVIELEAYQIARLTSFLDPATADPRGSFYNTQQSLIAVGSGGFAGKGLLQGTQTNLSYVPENHTDFIFTVIGEEFGFLGAIVVLALFAILLWRGLRIAAMAKDLFGTLVATGAVAIFAVQIFINIGMTIGVSPVTGIPLPFVSYGGTSLIAGYLLVGLMLNVHMRRF